MAPVILISLLQPIRRKSPLLTFLPLFSLRVHPNPVCPTSFNPRRRRGLERCAIRSVRFIHHSFSHLSIHHTRCVVHCYSRYACRCKRRGLHHYYETPTHLATLVQASEDQVTLRETSHPRISDQGIASFIDSRYVAIQRPNPYLQSFAHSNHNPPTHKPG